MSSGADSLGSQYDRLYPDEPSGPLKPTVVRGWPHDRNEALVCLARPGKRLLDIGCGRGTALFTLASRFEEVVGIELSAVQADLARRNLASLPNCQILMGSLERLADVLVPPFDCIVWGDVIEHVVDVIKAMRLIASLSRQGTQLITVTPNAAYLLQRLRAALGHAPNTSLPCHRNEGFAASPSETVLLDGGHLHYFTFRQVEILYQIAGFHPTRRLGLGRRLPRLRNLWPALLSGAVCVSGTYLGAGS